MQKNEVQAATNQIYNATVAATYEAERGHGFLNEVEAQAWHDDLAEMIEIMSNARVLDVGSGTGVLTRLLAEWGGYVVGLDSSPDMVAEARNRIPAHLTTKIEFQVGDTMQDALRFPAQTFDCIASRQVVCHFVDPLQAFRNWYHWLKPNGQIIVIDGLWTKESWGDDDLTAHLPLAFIQNRATLTYLLEQAGFLIEQCRWLERVNRFLETTEQHQRYIVIG